MVITFAVGGLILFGFIFGLASYSWGHVVLSAIGSGLIGLGLTHSVIDMFPKLKKKSIKYSLFVLFITILAVLSLGLLNEKFWSIIKSFWVDSYTTFKNTCHKTSQSDLGIVHLVNNIPLYVLVIITTIAILIIMEIDECSDFSFSLSAVEVCVSSLAPLPFIMVLLVSHKFNILLFLLTFINIISCLRNKRLYSSIFYKSNMYIMIPLYPLSVLIYFLGPRQFVIMLIYGLFASLGFLIFGGLCGVRIKDPPSSGNSTKEGSYGWISNCTTVHDQDGNEYTVEYNGKYIVDEDNNWIEVYKSNNNFYFHKGNGDDRYLYK